MLQGWWSQSPAWPHRHPLPSFNRCFSWPTFCQDLAFGSQDALQASQYNLASSLFSNIAWHYLPAWKRCIRCIYHRERQGMCVGAIFARNSGRCRWDRAQKVPFLSLIWWFANLARLWKFYIQCGQHQLYMGVNMKLRLHFLDSSIIKL